MTISQSSNILTIGHSLVGSQIPHFMNSFGNAGKTDVQLINGAPLRVSWSDHDRAHVQGVDSHRALATGTYDALILTEAVPLETNVQWNDTSGNALKFFNLAHASNPDIQLYLYETWNGFDFFGGDLKAWRASLDTFSPIWEGVVDKVNAGRPAGSKEMLVIPAGQAMANLYDAIAEGRIPGVTSIRQFFVDDIHPTDAGFYYVTMVHQATLYGKDPSGLTTQMQGDYGPYPAINPTIAASLQKLAWDTVMEYDRDGVNEGTTPVPTPTPTPTPVPPVVEPEPEEPVVTPTPVGSDDNDLTLYKLGEKAGPDSWLISEWNAGQTSNMAWSANNIKVAANGDISLSLTKAPAGSTRPYLGGEIQSSETATTGTWSWTAQAPVMAPGAVFGMFTYKADWKNDPWVEFDFEFVGADTTKVQLAIHMENAQGQHMVLTPEAQKRATIDLGFDASKGMHTYEVSVTDTNATFYIDGKQVAQFSAADMQQNVWQIGPMVSFVDLWSVSPGQEAWAGKWTDPGRDLVAIVEGADIRPGEFGSAIEPVNPPVIAPQPPVEGIFGDDNANILNGTSGDDKLYGRGGNDTLDGKAGADEMHGGTGNDVYWVDNAGDRTIELANQGRDLVNSTRDWVLGANIEDLSLRTSANLRGEGNSLDNTISGNSGNNGLLGMAGNDILLGHEGNDTLVGGTGNDTLTGGAGKDTFRFTSGDGRDTITDFDARGGEVLDIRGYANVTDLISENGGTRIVLGANDSIFLQGVDKAALNTGNFLFNGTAPTTLVGAQPPVTTPPVTPPVVTPPAPTPEGVLSNPSMGIGLNGVSDWSSQVPFIDVFKSSRPWTGHLEGRWGGASKEQLDAVTDADGYLTTLPPGVTHVSALFLTEMPAAMTSIAGTYRITYEGEGNIVLHGGSNVRYGDGEIWFDYTPNGTNMVSLDITRINSADHIRDISVVHQKNIPAFEAGKIFNPDWVALIDDMRSLRFMDWQATNDSDLSKWADRAQSSDATWTTEAGVPLDVMVKLANETGTDPWFNIPHKADADFMRNFVTYVKDNLDPDLKPSFEYSNEVWNWQFGQAQWANTEGQKLWPGQGDAWVQFYGKKAAEMATIVNEVYGPNANALVNKVIATHTAWRGLEESILEAPNAVRDGSPTPAGLFNDYAITGYFDGSLGREKAATVLNWIASSETAAANQGRALGLSGTALTNHIQEHKYDQAITLAIRELRDGSVTGNRDGSISSLLETFAYHKAVADKYGMDLVMYEGGTHVVGVGEWAHNPTLASFFMALNQSDAMGGLYLELMEGWKKAGGTLFNAFVDVAKHGTYGSWGALQHLDDQSERWDAIVDFNARNPGWWENRDPDAFVGTGEGDEVTLPPITPPVTPQPEPEPVPVTPTPAPEGIFGDDNANTLNGTSGNDKLYGRGGNDTLDGKAGADEMHGGTGNDVYWVDNAGDRTIELANQGRDLVNSTRDWVLGANIEDLSLRTSANLRGEGNSLDNTITGNSGNNALLGMAGNDLLLGHEGNDTLVGGTGNDTLTGGAGKDAFRFSKGDGRDVITDFDTNAGELIDVRGYARYSSLVSESGGTRMVFEGGDSLFFQGVAKAALTGAHFTFNGVSPKNLADVGPVITPPATGPITVESATSRTLGADQDHLTLVGKGYINGTGNARDNILTGNAVSNILRGESGNDRLYGGGGGDRLFGGAGNDHIFLDAGNDTLDGGDGQDWVMGSGKTDARIDLGATKAQYTGHGTDLITGFEHAAGAEGNDRLWGSNGANTLEGHAGNDHLIGGAGDDRLFGGAGNDHLFLDAGNDLLDGGEGQDTVVIDGSQAGIINLGLNGAQNTGFGMDTLVNIEHATGGNGADRLFGNAGNNHLYGRGGDDRLFGGQGQDVLKGGAGFDVMYGGQDRVRDVFVFESTSETQPGRRADVIHDFVAGIDRIDLRAIDAHTKQAGDQSFVFATKATANAVWSVRDGNDLLVRGDVNGDRVTDFEMRLSDVASVTAQDFVL